MASTSKMLAIMTEGVAVESLVNRTQKPDVSIDAPQLKPNSELELLLSNILGESYTKNHSPME